MPVYEPMLGVGVRWKPLRDQVIYLAAEQQIPLDHHHGQADVMLRASASFFNSGKYSDDWHPTGNGWMAQNLYLDAAHFVKADYQVYTADYRMSWHQKINGKQTIEPYWHAQYNASTDNPYRDNTLGGVGVRLNTWCWVDVLGEKSIAGWYISSELDDLRWRDPQMQQAALSWLSKTRLSLAAVANKPVAVSSFFAGNMTPDSYSKWVTTLSHSGVKVWVQDGAGTQMLTAAERALYLKAPSAGKVIELFRQDKQAKTFKATPAPAEYQQKWLATPVPPGQDRVYFSLRYMSAASGVLAM